MVSAPNSWDMLGYNHYNYDEIYPLSSLERHFQVPSTHPLGLTSRYPQASPQPRPKHRPLSPLGRVLVKNQWELGTKKKPKYGYQIMVVKQ